jgi:hypothetical protein
VLAVKGKGDIERVELSCLVPSQSDQNPSFLDVDFVF